MLQLKLTKVSASSDGTLITVQDTTGAYNGSTNTGGYGTPNPAAPAYVLLRWKMFSACAWTVFNSSFTQSALAAGVALNTAMLGLSTAPGLFPDGINSIEYDAGYALTGNAVTLNGLNTITSNGLDLSTLSVGMYLSFGYNYNTLYKVLSISNGVITLDTPYGGTFTSETVRQWYSTELDVLVQTLGKNRIDDRLARIPANQMVDKQIDDLCLMVMNSMAAQAKFDAGDIAGANDLAVAVGNQCINQPSTW